MPTASEAYALPAGSPNFCKTQYNPTYEDRRAFADGYGKYMDYQQASGAGGTPLLISAGPDGKFGTEDDIRSDRR
jgi:hypothetical protein